MASFAIHRTETENFDENGRDRVVRRHDFLPPAEGVRRIRNSLGLVVADAVYTGVVATINGPDGARIETLMDAAGNPRTILRLPSGEGLSPEEAVGVANKGRLGLTLGAPED
jgi:hypothetical protein